jgi:hypothetical protein
LYSPAGESIQVHCGKHNRACFDRKIPVPILNAVSVEFDIDLSEVGEEAYVTVEGPSCSDAELMMQWLQAAIECDRLLEQYRQEHPEFRDSISNLEVIALIYFKSAATAFLRKWLKSRVAFSLSLRSSFWITMFTIMVGIGFFTRTGDRYQITVPNRISIDEIAEASIALAQTEDDQYYLHPERFLVTTTRYWAKSIRQRLRSLDESTRLAEREVLLAASSAQSSPDSNTN